MKIELPLWCPHCGARHLDKDQRTHTTQDPFVDKPTYEYG